MIQGSVCIIFGLRFWPINPKEFIVVKVVKNGREALALLANYPFDCVLMDVRMSIMDGFEAAQCIREKEASTAYISPLLR